MKVRAAILVAVLLTAGCIRRQVTVTSDPPGALVYLNNQEIGRTPFKREFTWYGRYDLDVRMDGYQTISAAESIYAPWYQWVPLDFATDLLPITDNHPLHYTLTPASTQPAESKEVLKRAEELKGQLQGVDD